MIRGIAMQIHLIRHGKTEANEKRLYCGPTDLPLSENGAAEISRMNERGLYPPPAGITFYTSGLLRTEQTLNLIHGAAERTAVPGLAELDFGAFEMKSYEELKERDDYQAGITDETGDVACPGGESKNQVQKRILDGYACILEEVLQAKCNSVFICCHGGTIACIMESLQPDIKNFYEWQPQPGRGYSLIYESGRFEKYNEK
jgi:alpha-ribazole phosphatase